MLIKIRDSDEPGSILGALFNFFPADSDLKWNILIGLEAALAVLVSSYLAIAFGIPEAGLASIALASAAIVPRVNQIQRLNRDRIWELGYGGWTANSKSIVSGTTLFIAMVIAYTILASLTDRSVLVEHFRFIVGPEVYDNPQLSPERFSHGMTFMVTNFFVLIVFFILAFVYRGLGTSLALGWNAGVWSVSIVLMVKSGMAASESSAVLPFIAIAALSPHIILEGMAYLSGSLAAIFLSRGITLYKMSDPRLLQVVNAVSVLVFVSIGLVVLAALVEDQWAPFILRLL